MSSLSCRVLMLTSLVASLACVSSPAANRASVSLVGDSTAVLREVEIAHAGTRTAYDTIRRLRPEYLAFTRRNETSEEIAVYVDGIRLGTVAVLHTVPSHAIREIRRLSAREATTRFGTGHSAGAILIATKAGR